MKLENIIKSSVKGVKYIRNSISKNIKKTTSAVALGTILSVAPINSTYAFDSDVCKAVIVGNGVLQGLIAGSGGWQSGEPFWRSFAKGLMGGSLIGAGKCMVAKDLDYAWPAKMTTALGTSISYNATNGKSPLDSFGFDYGPAFFEWKKNDNGNYDFKTYVLPDSVVGMIRPLSEGDKFDAKASLKYGTLIFVADEINDPVPAFATTSANIIRIVNKEKFEKHRQREQFLGTDKGDLEMEEVLRHELIHTHQYMSSRPLGNFVFNIYESYGKRIRSRLLQPLHLNLDHAVGNGIFGIISYGGGKGNDSLKEKEAYGLTK